MYCTPRHYKPLPNTLYRNNGDGTFTDVSVETGIADHFGRGMGVAVADYDGDGYPDIFVANDDAPMQLFHNIGGKRFEEVALDSGVAFPGKRQRHLRHGRPISATSSTRASPASGSAPSKKRLSHCSSTSARGQFDDRTAPSKIAWTPTRCPDGPMPSSISITTAGRT
jgi:hypothetical protein